MKKTLCPICGREFEADKPNRRYCSLECRETGRKLKRRQWENENPNYNAEYMRKYRGRASQNAV